ncbi:MAG: phage major capsid protein, partial [Luteolibacter sp.]
MTDFPTEGDDSKVSLRNSQYSVFDKTYAESLRIDYPSIWDAGGNIQGNESYRYLQQALDGETSDKIEEIIRMREAWCARHFEDGKQFKDADQAVNKSSVAGVVAQIKWLCIGTLGESRMKEVINELKSKQDGDQSDDRSVNIEIHVHGEGEHAEEMEQSESVAGDYDENSGHDMIDEQKACDEDDDKMPSRFQTGEIVHRSAQIMTRAINDEQRTVELSFSSEEPIERSYGMEILGHGENEMKLDRLNSGAPLLLNHDTEKQIGVVEKAWVENGRGRAVVRFSKGQLGQEIFQDVRDGIRRLVSVGYSIEAMEDVTAQMARGDGIKSYRITRSQPMEISIVGIPADNSVGVDRSIEQPKPEPHEKKMNIEVIERKVDGLERKLDELSAKMEKPDDLNVGPGSDNKELRKYNLGSAIDGFINRRSWDGIEKEVSDTLRGKYGGYRGNSLIVPFGTRNVTTSTSGSPYGGYVQDKVVEQPVDALRATSFFDALGVRMLTGLTSAVDIPVLETKSAVAVNTEGGTLSGTADPVFAQKQLSPKIVQGLVPISRALLATGVMDVSAFIQADIEKQLAAKMEDLFIQGSGSSGQPTGIKTLSGISTSVVSATNGTTLTYSDVLKLSQDVQANNANLNAVRYLTSAAGFGKLRRTEISSSTAQFVGTFTNGNAALGGFPAVISNNVPANGTKGTGTALTQVYAGDFTFAVVAMFGGGIEIIIDEVTAASSNLVKINAIVHWDF